MTKATISQGESCKQQCNEMIKNLISSEKMNMFSDKIKNLFQEDVKTVFSGQKYSMLHTYGYFFVGQIIFLSSEDIKTFPHPLNKKMEEQKSGVVFSEKEKKIVEIYKQLKGNPIFLTDLYSEKEFSFLVDIISFLRPGVLKKDILDSLKSTTFNRGEYRSALCFTVFEENNSKEQRECLELFRHVHVLKLMSYFSSQVKKQMALEVHSW